MNLIIKNSFSFKGKLIFKCLYEDREKTFKHNVESLMCKYNSQNGNIAIHWSPAIFDSGLEFLRCVLFFDLYVMILNS